MRQMPSFYAVTANCLYGEVCYVNVIEIGAGSGIGTDTWGTTVLLVVCNISFN